MKHPIYSTYDRVAELYSPLIGMTNDQVAIRTFNEACKESDGFKQHPQDMEMHRIGYFDDESGSFTEDKEILEKGWKE